MHAAASAGTRHGSVAPPAAHTNQARAFVQLPGGNRSRAKHGRSNRCQKHVLDCLAHGSPSFSVHLMLTTACCYFPAGVTPASLVVQNAVNGVVKEQTQLEVGQGLVRLQVPPHVDP